RIELKAPPTVSPRARATLVVTVSGVGDPESGTITVRTIDPPLPIVQQLSLTDLVVNKTRHQAVRYLVDSPFGSAMTPKIIGIQKAAGLKVTGTGTTTLNITPTLRGRRSFTYLMTDVGSRGNTRAVRATVTVVVGTNANGAGKQGIQGKQDNQDTQGKQ